MAIIPCNYKDIENIRILIRKKYFNNKYLKSYIDIFELIENLDGKIKLVDKELKHPIIIKNKENTFTIFIEKEKIERAQINKKSELRFILQICAELGVLFLTTGYKIHQKIWDKIPIDIPINETALGINNRIVEFSTVSYFAHCLYVGKKRFFRYIKKYTNNNLLELSDEILEKIAKDLNVNTFTLNCFISEIKKE